MACNDLNCWCNIDGKGHLRFNESEHDRTGGPSGVPVWDSEKGAYTFPHPYSQCSPDGDCACPVSDSIGVPLQDQVEQVEQVEDALGKALTVIEAFVEQEKDLRTLVYQAQLDAQDWQNKYRTEKAWADIEQSAKMAMFRAMDAKYVDHTDGYKDDIGRLEGLLYDEKQKTLDYENLRARVYKLTDENAQLEVRNERQKEMIEYAKCVLVGNDLNGNSIHKGSAR